MGDEISKLATMGLWPCLMGRIISIVHYRFIFVVCTVGSKLSFSLDKVSLGEEIKMVDQVFKQATMVAWKWNLQIKWNSICNLILLSSLNLILGL
ncbi:hypothetical protein CMV_010719 [Castanea mollissima]|uniref:Uncharacterized protein n=1 Tax=Castanea mollissima TaxID=60419 RepID=A0A8J4RHY7_9ROSI|nr:hypothetical protein CMV_010719 [Castanea mollissima]